MIEEAIQLIQATAVQADGVAIIKPEGLPSKVFLHLRRTNELREFNVEPPKIGHATNTLESLIKLAASCVRRDNLTTAAIWHSYEGVTFSFCDVQRKNFAMFKLKVDSRFAAVRNLHAQKFSQQEFLALLRHTLNGCSVNPTLVGAVQKVKFTRNEESGGDITPRGKESIGRSITQEVVAGSALPEEVILQVPVYENFAPGGQPAHPVRCLLDVDLTLQKFALMPFPGEVQSALDASQAMLHAIVEDGLKQEECVLPIYFGAP